MAPTSISSSWRRKKINKITVIWWRPQAVCQAAQGKLFNNITVIWWHSQAFCQVVEEKKFKKKVIWSASLTTNAQSTVEIICQSKNQIHTIAKIMLIPCLWCVSLQVWRGLKKEEKKDELTKKAEKGKGQFLSAGRACKAMLWPTPASEVEAIGSFVFSAQRTFFISLFVGFCLLFSLFFLYYWQSLPASERT